MPASPPAPGREETRSPVLRVTDLDVDYRDPSGGRIRVVSAASLELAPGEALGVLGESGCGKTTLARAILGILPSAAEIAGGSVRLGERELLGLPERELESVRGRSVAMIFQEPGLALSPLLRVGDQIGDALGVHLGVARPERRPRVEALLELTGFSDPARVHDAFPHQLSGGQLQRVVLARAIAGRPRVLLADEPTSAVDATVQRQILEILERLRRELELAVLFISHDPALLGEVCDRILVMYSGRVVEVGRRDRILERPLHPYTLALLACAPSAGGGVGAGRLATIEGAPPDPARPPLGCRFAPRCSERLSECDDLEPPASSPAADHLVRCFLHEA